MAPLGYLYASIFSYTLSILSWIAVYPIFTFSYKIDPVNAVFSILVFNVLLIGFTKYKNIIEKTELEWTSKLRNVEQSKKRFQEEAFKLDLLETDVIEAELGVVKLYEITKKMSETLKFDSIFDILSAFLKDNFVFQKSELIILKENNSGLTMDRVYKVWGRTGKSPQEPETDYNGIIKLCLKNNKEAYLTRETKEAMFKSLHLSNESDTFFAIPLFSERKMVGILTVENLLYIDREKFIILATQFALELKKVLLYEKVDELAITDSLTGLYVRRYFLERMTEELQRSKRYKFKFAVLMIDVDNFKKCNDTYGHLVGDIILRDVARIIKQNTREIDLAAKYGGEEFCLVLTETAREEAKTIGERIRVKVEENVFKAYDETLKITVSIGISIYPGDSVDRDELIEKADRALYSAKNAGKNVVYAFKR